MNILVWEKLKTVDGKLDAVLALLTTLNERIESIMATQAEIAAKLNAATDELKKVGGEVKTLLTKIDELQAAVVAAGNVTPELQAAVDAVVEQAKVVDDLVPDVTP